MHKYKAGDKIRYIRNTITGQVTKGKIYIVNRLVHTGDPVIINDAGREDYWFARHFEPYEDTDLKVGQTVRVYKSEENRDEPALNNAILKLIKFDGVHWCAETLDGSDYWYFSPEELKPFDTHGLDIVHADDKTVTVRLTHEELAWLGMASDYAWGMNKSNYSKNYNVNIHTNNQCMGKLQTFVKNSPLLDHLRPEPEPEKWAPKPGDPVRCIKGFSSLYESYDNITLGKVYIVDKLVKDKFLVTTSMKSKNAGFIYTEHFEPATDFRVGDVVEVVGNSGENYAGQHLLEIGGVYEIAERGTHDGNWRLKADTSSSIVYFEDIRHTDKPLSQQFKPGWYVQVESDVCFNITYLIDSHRNYKTRIDTDLRPIKLDVSYDLCDDRITVSDLTFTESELRQHALDIMCDGQKTIGCQTITREELPELIKFFEEFIPMARKAVADEKARLGR